MARDPLPGTILDPYGRPYRRASGSLYEATTDTSGRYRPRPNMVADYSALLNESKWRAAISDCRFIGKQGIVRAAIVQKWQYASTSAWAPIFTGEDSEWGDLAEAALARADLAASVRGSRYPFARMIQIGGRSWETDGGFFLLLTQTKTGFPQFQPLEAHRIGSRHGDPDIVETGPYRGLPIQNGIITNEAGAEVAYRVLGSTPSADLDISARDLWHIAPADNFSENRPLPGIARGSLDLYDLTNARKAALAAQILDSKQTMIETNASGRPDPVRDLMDGGSIKTPTGAPTEVIEDGQTRFIKSGFNLTPWETKRPSGEWMAYDDKTLKTALSAIGWRAEALDPALMNTGAPTRALQDIINTTLMAAYEDMRPYVNRARHYQIAKLIKRGDLPPSDEWMAWDTPPPAEFTVDPSRSITSDLEAARAGADNIPNIMRRWGYQPKQVLTGQARYLKLRNEIAAQHGVPPEQLGRLDQPGDAPPTTP
jgi:hypothetical protein